MIDGQRGLGAIHTPKQGNRLQPRTTWCADNGCFGKGYPGDDRWLSWLASYDAEEKSRCMFATAPDIVGGGLDSLARSLPHLSAIRALGYPAALVGQDGMRPEDLPWAEFDALFIGGSTEWKLGAESAELVRAAKGRGMWVHMGRVNSLKRMRYAASLGVDSSDGTFIAFGPDVNLPKVLGWLHKVNDKVVEE